MTDRNYVKNAMNLLTQLKDKYKDELNQNESNYEHMDIVKHKVVINLTNTCLKKYINCTVKCTILTLNEKYKRH